MTERERKERSTILKIYKEFGFPLHPKYNET